MVMTPKSPQHYLNQHFILQSKKKKQAANENKSATIDQSSIRTLLPAKWRQMKCMSRCVSTAGLKLLIILVIDSRIGSHSFQCLYVVLSDPFVHLKTKECFLSITGLQSIFFWCQRCERWGTKATFLILGRNALQKLAKDMWSSINLS